MGASGRAQNQTIVNAKGVQNHNIVYAISTIYELNTPSDLAMSHLSFHNVATLYPASNMVENHIKHQEPVILEYFDTWPAWHIGLDER